MPDAELTVNRAYMYGNVCATVHLQGVHVQRRMEMSENRVGLILKD